MLCEVLRQNYLHALLPGLGSSVQKRRHVASRKNGSERRYPVTDTLPTFSTDFGRLSWREIRRAGKGVSFTATILDITLTETTLFTWS